MKILITGGGGFIGSHLTARLLEEGHSITAIDIANTGKVKEFLQDSNYNYIKDSVMNRKIIDELAGKTDVIVHLASICRVKEYINRPEEVITINVLGTKNILEAARKHGCKVIYASSSEIYGKNKHPPFKEDDNRLLGPTSDPRWSYSTSKACAESLCFSHMKKGVDCRILRYFNVYGPKLDKVGEGRVISSMIGDLLKKNIIKVTGDGLQTRSFIYIDDAIDATYEAIIRETAKNKVFNIGTEDEITMEELSRKIMALSKKDPETRFVSKKEFLGRDYDDVPRRAPDNTCMKEVLGVKPKISLDEGLKRTYEWFRKQR